MKTNKELLIIAKNNKFLFYKGLCSLFCDLYLTDIITSKERNKIDRYLRKNAPDSRYKYYPYYWEPRDWTIRLKWINQQIKKLS
jgi:hypothetical protein